MVSKLEIDPCLFQSSLPSSSSFSTSTLTSFVPPSFITHHPYIKIKLIEITIFIRKCRRFLTLKALTFLNMSMAPSLFLRKPYPLFQMVNSLPLLTNGISNISSYLMCWLLHFMRGFSCMWSNAKPLTIVDCSWRMFPYNSHARITNIHF